MSFFCFWESFLIFLDYSFFMVKVLFFSDFHNQEVFRYDLDLKAEEADLIVCAGDFTIFESDIEDVLSWMNSWGKKVLLIHGNHESESTVRSLVKDYPNLRFIHGSRFRFRGIDFLGWGGGGFSDVDEGLLRKIPIWERLDGKKVFVSHAPPFGTKLDYLGEHVGNHTIRKAIKLLKPLVAVSGHIHETAGEKDHLGKSLLLNPGPSGVIIDL